MLTRILRVAGIELGKLRRRPVAWGLLGLVLLVVIGRAAATALEVEGQRDRTRELNAWLVFADASDTGLFVSVLLLVLLASVAFAGEATLGTLKGLLVRPVTRVELALGKLAALLAAAFGLAAAVLAAAAGAGAVLSDYEGVRTVAHNERTAGLLAGAYEDADPAAKDRPDLKRLGFTGHWDETFSALRVDRVVPGSLAESRQIQPGDIVTHAAAGSSPPARLKSLGQWTRLAAALPEGGDLQLQVDTPIVAPNPDYTAGYLAGQAGRALAMIPLALAAAVAFGFLWSSLVDSAGLAVGGTLLSFLALRFVAAPLLVSAARLAGAANVFVADVERYLFTSWLAWPMEHLHFAAAATANKEIRPEHLQGSLGVCAATAALFAAAALWRFRRKDVI